jgi:hypothetical protein
MAYRKRIKKTKLNSLEEVLKMCCDQAKQDLGRELTTREIKYLKKRAYRARKKLMKGYTPIHSIPKGLIDILTDQFNQLCNSMLEYHVSG